MNFFMFCGNTIHLLAFCILIGDIIKKQDCDGISGKSQLLLTMVFLCRYTDLWTDFISYYNTAMKIAFIGLSFVTIYLIYFKYRKSYDDRNDTFWNTLLIVPVAGFGMAINYYFLGGPHYELWKEALWAYSIYLEAVAIIPQFYMIKKSGDGQRILNYVVTLCIYRSLYIMNWIFRYLNENHVDMISSIAGSIQTIILIAIIVEIQKQKERRTKWQEITNVFTIEAFKIARSTEDAFKDIESQKKNLQV